MSDKDQVFWDALMEKNKSGSEKKIFRKFKKHSKVIDSKHLAEVFNVDKKEIEQVISYMNSNQLYCNFILSPESSVNSRWNIWKNF